MSEQIVIELSGAGNLGSAEQALHKLRVQGQSRLTTGLCVVQVESSEESSVLHMDMKHGIGSAPWREFAKFKGADNVVLELPFSGFVRFRRHPGLTVVRSAGHFNAVPRAEGAVIVAGGEILQGIEDAAVRAEFPVPGDDAVVETEKTSAAVDDVFEWDAQLGKWLFLRNEHLARWQEEVALADAVNIFVRAG